MSLLIVGIIEPVSVGDYTDVLAKIDTGADSSTIWASNVHIDENGVLRFSLFDKESPHYDGKIFKRKDFSAVRVKSSNGHAEIRYRTHFSVKIAGRRIKILMSLTDRSQNEFSILIGRRTIAGRFLVDVTKIPELFEKKRKKNRLNKELQKNPHAFHKKYIKKGRE